MMPAYAAASADHRAASSCPSRAAPGACSACLRGVAGGGLFFSQSSGLFRLRIVIMSVLAFAALLILALLVILQIPGVAEMLLGPRAARAGLRQRAPRPLRRYGIGFLMAMEHPFGIGPLVFGQIFGEDTHNIWLKALMDYGWLGFASSWADHDRLDGGWPASASCFRNRPWQPYLLCAYVVFVGHVALGSIIDTDHWRHFLPALLGLIWGGMALERRSNANNQIPRRTEWLADQPSLRLLPGWRLTKALRGSERSAAR
jgi:hypothetical protein